MEPPNHSLVSMATAADRQSSPCSDESQLLWPDNALDYHGEPCGTNYRLFAVVFHRGRTVRSGHYFAVIHASAGEWDRAKVAAAAR